MKIKLTIAIVLAMFALNCNKECKTYELRKDYSITVPKENIDKYLKAVNDIVKNASYHMSGGDYEDPYQTINTAERIAKEMYGQYTYGLTIRYCNRMIESDRIYSDNLDKSEQEIVKNLMIERGIEP